MASQLACGVCAAAVLAKLRARQTLLDLVPASRIDDHVSPRPVYPYVQVESSGETPFNTMGAPTQPKFGSSVRVDVRAVSQRPGESEVAAIINEIKAELDGQLLTVAGYGSTLATFENLTLLTDTINGPVTREWIAEFDVTVHQ